MTTIRKAYSWEMGSIATLAKEFHADAGLGGVFDRAALIGSLEQYRDAGILRVFVMEVDGHLAGVIAGVRSRQLMCSTILLEELFWYVLPEHRGGTGGIRLLQEFEKCAMAECDGLVMARLFSTGGDTLHNYYERRGLRCVESHYLKLFS